MNVGKVLMGAGAVVGLLSSTVAMAEVRSSSALPSARSVATAPVSGVRHSTTLKRTSAQSDDSMAGTYIVGGLAAAAVIAGIVVVASDNNNNAKSGG
ncbi:MAG: hypothetical protein ACTHM8_11890 [Sphingomonas sp.]